MKSSLMNSISGKIVSVVEGAVGCIVSIETADGFQISAYVLMESVKALNLKEGMSVAAVFAASGAILGSKDTRLQNAIEGVVSAVQEGAICGMVYVDAGDNVIVADALLSQIQELGISVGSECLVGINPWDVMIGVL